MIFSLFTVWQDVERILHLLIGLYSFSVHRTDTVSFVGSRSTFRLEYTLLALLNSLRAGRNQTLLLQLRKMVRLYMMKTRSPLPSPVLPPVPAQHPARLPSPPVKRLRLLSVEPRPCRHPQSLRSTFCATPHALLAQI